VTRAKKSPPSRGKKGTLADWPGANWDGNEPWIDAQGHSWGPDSADKEGHVYHCHCGLRRFEVVMTEDDDPRLIYKDLDGNEVFARKCPGPQPKLLADHAWRERWRYARARSTSPGDVFTLRTARDCHVLAALEPQFCWGCIVCKAQVDPVTEQSALCPRAIDLERRARQLEPLRLAAIDDPKTGAVILADALLDAEIMTPPTISRSTKTSAERSRRQLVAQALRWARDRQPSRRRRARQSASNGG